MTSKNQPSLIAALSFVTILLIWELLSRYGGISQHVLPGPTAVFASMWELAVSGKLLRHTVASLFRVTTGFYLASLSALPLGIVLGRRKWIKLLINPLIQFLRPISPLAWIPLAMLLLGIGDKPAIFLIFLSSFFPIVVSTTIAVNSINPVYFHVAANFKFSRMERLTKIIIPAILPSVFIALRISLGIAWIVVVAAEMIAVKSGLGYLIIDSRNALRMDYVLDGMIVIGTIGLLLDSIMKRFGKIESAFWGSKR